MPRPTEPAESRSPGARPRARRRVYWRAAVFNVAMGLLVALVAVITGPFVPFLPRSKVRAIAAWWCRANLFLLRTIVGVDLEVRGLEHVPRGAALVAVKHQSALETFGIMPCLPDPTFVLKRELTWLPLFGWFLIRLKMIAIDRKAGAAALVQIMEQAAAVAAEGRQIVIYPEGTRRAVGDPPRYKLGAAHLYERLSVPCVPVAVDTGVFWPRDVLTRRQGRAVIEFLEPIPAGLPRDAFQNLLKDRIEKATDALVSEAVGPAEAAAATASRRNVSDRPT